MSEFSTLKLDLQLQLGAVWQHLLLSLHENDPPFWSIVAQWTTCPALSTYSSVVSHLIWSYRLLLWRILGRFVSLYSSRINVGVNAYVEKEATRNFDHFLHCCKSLCISLLTIYRNVVQLWDASYSVLKCSDFMALLIQDWRVWVLTCVKSSWY